MTRIVDPRDQQIRSNMGAEGYVSQRQLAQRDDEQRRFLDDDTSSLIVQETFTSYKADLAANLTTTMHFDFRSSSTAVVIQAQALDVPANARLLVCRIVGTADVTAGTITPQLRVSDDGVTDFWLIEACELSAAVPRTVSARFPWAGAYQMSAGATWQMQLVADSAYLPTGSVDYVVKTVWGFDPWDN